MSRTCDICGKGAMNSNQISHAHKISRKKQYPNLKMVSVVVSGNRHRIKACTRCLSANKIYAKA